MAQKKKNDISKLQFEEAVGSLTSIVNNIESGETDLQSSLEQYERGMELINHCRGILQVAEKRIEKIAAARSDTDKQDDKAKNENEKPPVEKTGNDNDKDALF
jgi:exodeoxyribonuclease VII small subunit